MYSHIFNYETMNRDGHRMMETSAAVAGGGKSFLLNIIKNPSGLIRKGFVMYMKL